jgi:uncharacterized membrane protein HdeD (DUF308 family)
MSTLDIRVEPADERGAGMEQFWYLPVVGGVIALVFGVLVLARPDTSLKTLAVIVGIYLVLGGVIAIAHLFANRDDETVGLAWLVLGMVSLIAGLVVIRHPSESLTAVALAVGIYFIAAGAVELSWAIIRPGHRLATLARAVIAIAAGCVILASPNIGVKTLALIVGIALCLQGIAQIVIGVQLRARHGHAEAGIAS